MKLTEKQFELMAHTLGVNPYRAKHSILMRDKVLPKKFYRNYFCCGKNKEAEWEQLKEMGYAKSWQQKYTGCEPLLYYCVSDEGIEVFKQKYQADVIDPFVPPSKAKITYEEYLRSECSETFSEYLGIQLPKYEHRGNYSQREVRMISTKYNGVKGSWESTQKKAKASYKVALSKFKAELKSWD